MKIRQAIKRCAVGDEEIRLSGRPEAMKIHQAIKRCAVDDEEIRLSGRPRGNEDPSSDQALCCGRRGDQVVRRCQVVQRQ